MKSSMYQLQLRRATEMSQATLKHMRKRRKLVDPGNSLDMDEPQSNKTFDVVVDGLRESRITMNR